MFVWRDIPDLEIAVSHFGLTLVDSRRPTTVNLIRRDKVLGHIEKLDDKYFMQEHDAKESGYGYVVKKQEWPRRADYPLAIIMREEFTNGLGMEDFYYYFIMYRHKLSTGWFKTFDLKKYERQPGIYIPFDILARIRDDKVLEQSRLVIVMEDSTIYIMDAKPAFDFYEKNGKPLFLNSRGLLMTGLPISEFKKLTNPAGNSLV